MKSFYLLLVIAGSLVFFGCKKISIEKLGTEVPDHQLLDTLLSRHVNEDGWVDYPGLEKDSLLLNDYLRQLENSIPNDSNWARGDKIAYWINLYNAFTLRLILDHYPVKSIKDIGSSPQIPFVNTPWDIKFISLNGKKYDLNNIEHNILRKFGEPRIHFAIVCASRSCPKLRGEAYRGKTLDTQLASQTKEFLKDPTRNDLKNEEEIRISKIFQWFKGDFTEKGTVVDFINSQLNSGISSDVDVEYMSYDWSMNDLREK